MALKIWSSRNYFVMPLLNPLWEHFNTLETDRTAFEFGDFDFPLL